MGATAVVRFKVHKGLANRRKFTAPVFSRTNYFIDPRYAAPERFLGVMGMPINQTGEIEAENLIQCRRRPELCRLGIIAGSNFRWRLSSRTNPVSAGPTVIQPD
jgi:hypothetical protein